MDDTTMKFEEPCTTGRPTQLTRIDHDVQIARNASAQPFNRCLDEPSQLAEAMA